jgi:hypothetical protein
MLSDEQTVPQKWFEKPIEGTLPIWAETIFPLQFRHAQPFELVQVILGPLQCLCGFAKPAVVRGLGSANQLPDLPYAFVAETRLGSQLDILFGPIHRAPLGQESFTPGLPA